MSTTPKPSTEKPEQSKQGGTPIATLQQPLTNLPTSIPLPKDSGTTAPMTSKSTEVLRPSDRPSSSSGSKKEVNYNQGPRHISSSDSLRSSRSGRSTHSRRSRSRSRESHHRRRDSRDYDDDRYEKSDKYSEQQDRNEDISSSSKTRSEKRDKPSSTRERSPPRTKARQDPVPQTPAAPRPQTPKKNFGWNTSVPISPAKFAAKYIIPGPKDRHWTLVVPDWAEMLTFDTPGLLTTKPTTRTFEKEIAIAEVTKHVIALLAKDKAPSDTAPFYVRILEAGYHFKRGGEDTVYHWTLEFATTSFARLEPPGTSKEKMDIYHVRMQPAEYFAKLLEKTSDQDAYGSYVVPEKKDRLDCIAHIDAVKQKYL